MDLSSFEKKAPREKDAKESHHVEKNYELPDGRKILIGEERFKATEILF